MVTINTGYMCIFANAPYGLKKVRYYALFFTAFHFDVLRAAGMEKYIQGWMKT